MRDSMILYYYRKVKLSFLHKTISKLVKNNSVDDLRKKLEEFSRKEDITKILNKKNSKGETILSAANSEEAIDILLEYGTKVGFGVGKSYGNELHVLASRGYYESIMALISKSDPKEDYDMVNYKDSNHCTPLHILSRMRVEQTEDKYYSTINVLLSNNALINVKDNEGNTPVDYAIKNFNFKLLKLLYNKDHNDNSKVINLDNYCKQIALAKVGKVEYMIAPFKKQLKEGSMTWGQYVLDYRVECKRIYKEIQSLIKDHYGFSNKDLNGNSYDAVDANTSNKCNMTPIDEYEVDILSDNYTNNCLGSIQDLRDSV